MDETLVAQELALRSGREIVVELGCGVRKEFAGSIGVDVARYDTVDLVGAAEEVLALFPPGSVDAVYSRHFLEHVEDPAAVLGPHFTNPYFYSDPTHRHQFGLYSFAYFAESDLFHRAVPAYARVAGLRLVDVRLGFRSVRPFYLRHALRRALGLLVNSSRFAQEFYEDGLSSILSCYEVTAVMTKLRVPPAT
jgi:hypothetical protein